LILALLLLSATLNLLGQTQAKAATNAISKGGDGKGKLLSLRLVPENAVLSGARSSQRFVVLGKYSDRLERDVTSSSQFSTTDPGVVQISQPGLAEAKADGKTLVKVELNGRAAQATVRVEDAGKERPLTFQRDVAALLTRHGCNGSNCHGGVKGRGGFKLSLNGTYPREDFQWIMEGGTYQVLTDEPVGPRIPRINLKEPEKSLLLLKPTFTVPHSGGERFAAGSDEYMTLLKWIREGAAFGTQGDGAAKIDRIEVFPPESVLEPAGRQQLLVTAELSNGRREDITSQVLYVSNNPEVVTVTPEGVVEAVKPGETSVIVRAPGHHLSASFGVISSPIAGYPDATPKNFIDEFILSKLRRFHLIPSPLADDGEFLRRVCLDVTGTLPPPNRVREFLPGKDSLKREKLLEILFQSPEYVDYWTFRFADLFRVALFPSGGNAKFSRFYWEWLRKQIAENRPYNDIARERIAAQGYDGPSRHYLPILQPPLPEDAMAEEVRVFLGRRLDCAQCHNHPFEHWAQDQFWGMTAFFQRLTFYWFLEVGTEAIVLDDPDGYSRRGNMGKVVHPRTKKEVVPAFLDGKTLPVHSRQDPRMALAEWMTSHPAFAETAVNRMWGLFFGRGMVEPVDDFRSTNPPTHPELLKALAQDFKQNGYDLKHLIRQIVHSRTYQLSSVTNDTNRDDRTNFSRRMPRPLDAEILLDAISQVTEVPEIFRAGSGQAPPGTRAIDLKEPDMYPSQFLDVCNRPTRQMLPERNSKPSLRQALHRLAGTTYTGKLAASGGRIDRLLSGNASHRQIIEEFYLSALSRFPTEKEKAALEAAMLSELKSGKPRRQVVEDFCWAILNSQEFMNY
jgi:hypothetical protein